MSEWLLPEHTRGSLHGMVKRLLIGLLKGLVLGGVLGTAIHFAVGTHTLDPSAFLTFLFYGAVVAIAGAFAGQEPWKQGAWVSTLLKSIFGILIGMFLFWLSRKFLGLVPVPAVLGIPKDTHLVAAPLFMAPSLAALYSAFVEVDDGGENQAAQQGEAGSKSTGVRASGKKSPMEILDEIEVDEDDKASKKSRRK